MGVLHDLVMDGDIEELGKTLSQGAAVNELAKDCLNETALHTACHYGNRDAIALLLKKDADIYLGNIRGNTCARVLVARARRHAVDTKKQNEYVQCLQLLLAHEQTLSPDSRAGRSLLKVEGCSRFSVLTYVASEIEEAEHHPVYDEFETVINAHIQATPKATTESSWFGFYQRIGIGFSTKHHETNTTHSPKHEPTLGSSAMNWLSGIFSFATQKSKSPEEKKPLLPPKQPKQKIL